MRMWFGWRPGWHVAGLALGLALAPSAWAGMRRHDLPCIARQFKNRVQVRISTFTRLHVEDALMKMSLFKPSLSLYIILSCNSQ